MGYRKNLALALLMAFTGSFAFRLSVPVVAYYSRFVLEASATAIGALMTSFFAGRAPVAALAGHLYRGRRSLLAASLSFVGVALLTPLYALSRSLPVLLGLRLLQGSLLGYAWTIVQIVVGASSPAGLGATIYALYFVTGAISLPISNAVYALLAAQPPLIILSVAASAFAATGLMAGLMDYVEVKRAGRAEGGIKAGHVIPLLLFFMLSLRLATAFTTSDVTYVYLCEVYRLGRRNAVLLLAWASAAGLALSIPLNAIADRVSERLVVSIVGASVSSGLALFPIRSLPLSALGLSLLLTGMSSMTPLSRRIALRRSGSKGVGYVGAAGNVGVLLSSLLVGAIYDAAKAGGITPLGPFNQMMVLAAPLACLTAALTAALAATLKPS